MPPRRLLTNISTMRQASTQVPRVPPQAQRVGELGEDLPWTSPCVGEGACCKLGSASEDGSVCDIARGRVWMVPLYVMGLEQCL